MSAYTDSVESGLEGLTAVSTGLCPGCDECRETWGFETLEAFDNAVSDGEVFAEGSFSWSGCDICGSSLGGDFQPWHAIDEDGGLVHGTRACVDCIMYLANGEEPE